jgi:hypothetical protein
MLTFSGPTYPCELQQSGPEEFSVRSVIFTVPNQPLESRGLWKPNIKHCKICCRFDFDIGPVTEESSVEFNLMLDGEV